MGYLQGFGITFKKLFHGSDTGEVVTTQYPEVKSGRAARAHGRHILNRYEDGMEKCIGCELCAGVCPARCIYVRGADNPPDAPVSPGERWGFVYEINYLRCIHCDLCVEACPTEAITETKLFEFSFTNRDDAIYTRDELLVDDEGRPKMLPWEDWREGEEAVRSVWMRATSPSGSAAYEDRVAWSGELGYGVHPPEWGEMIDEPFVATVRGQDDDPAAQAGKAAAAAAQASKAAASAQASKTAAERSPGPRPDGEEPGPA